MWICTTSDGSVLGNTSNSDGHNCTAPNSLSSCDGYLICKRHCNNVCEGMLKQKFLIYSSEIELYHGMFTILSINLFFQDATFLFLAALIIAVAIEKVDLHRHLALTILLYVGGMATLPGSAVNVVMKGLVDEYELILK